MGHTKILVRLLGEAVDCWRPVDADKHDDQYQILGPSPDPDEEWEFVVGEVVQCEVRDGQLVATQLVRPAAGQRDLAHPLSLQGGRTDRRRRDLAQAVADAIDGADPIGLLATGAPADEYGLEIDSVLLRLPAALDVEDVVGILHEEFTKWFGADAAGSTLVYQSLASQIWQAVQQYRYAG